MRSYSILQWFLFFYIYCFFGWVWETMYVSICKARWVNRGFMHGPFLPIYGFGCTAMVFITLPLQGKYLIEFAVGMIGATIMEYYTGFVMEKIFKMRYWDYSNNKFNLHGYICLKSSICWGVFAILVPELLHKEVERFVLSVPNGVLEIVVLVLTAYISADFTESFKEAMDFKEILMNLAQSNKEIAAIEKRMQSISEFVYGDLKEKSEEGLKMINSKFVDGKRIYQQKTEHIFDMKNKISESLESIKTQFTETRELEKEGKSIREELEQYLERLNHEERIRRIYKNKRSVRRSFRIIQRNPDLTSKDFSDALIDIQELNDK